MIFHIGHPSYVGTNRYALAQGYSQALAELLRRHIRMADAQRVLKQAMAGSHATCSRYSRTSSGREVAIDTVEVCRSAIGA